MKHKTILNNNIIPIEYEYNYQQLITKKLDALSENFNQSIINEIVLWKVNRYVEVDDETITLLNRIKKDDRKMKIRLTRQLLVKLLGTKGIRLPMASTILRFKNSHIYQIIDQRAYRLINKDKLKLPRNIDKQIELYLNYLTKMKKICKQKNIPFYKADRILYELDKRLNKNVKIKNYA